MIDEIFSNRDLNLEVFQQKLNETENEQTQQNVKM